MYILYIYIYTIYIYMNFVILVFVTLVSHSHDLFQLVLLVETAYPIVNMIQVINKEARAT